MKRPIAAGLLVLALALPARAQPGRPPFRPPPPVPAIADLSGTWYLNGDRDKPCQIAQYAPGRRAEFTNENGDSAWGTVHRDYVYIPDWSDGRSQGLEGRVRGDRIVWPNGTYWSR